MTSFKKPIIERMNERYVPDPNSGCWLWTSYCSSGGYATIYINNKIYQAHRISYELHKGEIPNGLEIDHLCRVRCCVNPNHLEAVTRSINIKRGLAPIKSKERGLAKTHCKNGHPFIPENIYLRPDKTRSCRICRNNASLKYKSIKKLS